MANNMAGNPWVLDTASTTAKLNQVTDSVVFITALQWSGYTTPADQCILQDGHRGIDVCVLSGRDDLGPVDISPGGAPLHIRDPILKVLGSGILTVWLA